MPRYITNKKQNDVAEFTGSLNGDVVGPQNNTQISPGAILNADINASASIVDTKLAIISTNGKVANSATSATATATPNTIVLRDSNNNTTLNTVFGDLDSIPTGTVNIGTTNANTLNIGTAPTTQIVNVGTGSGTTTINLGGAGDTINVAGTLAYINTTNLNVTDSNITLNKGGANGSGGSSGISIEEGGTTTGYIQTDGTRASWVLKAPASAGTATITPGSGITINQSSHDPLTLGTANGLTLSTQQLSLGAASASTTGALTSTDWNVFNNAAISVSSGLSGDITGPLNATQISLGVIMNTDINANAAIADTKLTTISTAGKVANSATTGATASTPYTLCLRDGVGNIALNELYLDGNLHGNGGIFSSSVSTPVITTAGLNDLVLNPAGNNVNCSGKYLYNIADLSVDHSITASTISGALTGNVTGNCSGSAASFTGSLGGDITGTMGATQIAAGAILNADINASAAIADTKLATISTAGKIANCATTATATNTDGAIVLRNNTSGTNMGAINMFGNLYLARYPSGSDYRVLSMDGGNSVGYLYANFSQLGDGIHLGYNFYYPTGATTPTIPSPGGATSRLALTYGSISLCTGGNNIAPIEYLRVSGGVVSTQNSAIFSGPLSTTSITSSGSTIACNSKTLDSLTLTNTTATATTNNIAARSLLTSNGSVSTYSNPSPTSAGMALVSTSTSAAKWDYPQPWVYLANFGGPWTGSTYNQIGPYPWPNVPRTGKYLVEIKILGFSNTNNAAVNTIYAVQNSTNIKTFWWTATNQQEFSVRFIYNFPTTGGINLYGETNAGSVTINDHELYLLKINDN